MERGLISVANIKILKIAFILDEITLRELQKFIKEFSTDQDDINQDDITYSLVLNNGQRYSSLSLDEVLNFKNVKKTKIKSLSVGNRPSSNNRLLITFNNLPYKPIEYYLQVDDQKKFLHYNEEVVEFCETLKPMYSFLAVSYVWMYIIVTFPSLIVIDGLVDVVIDYFNLNPTLSNSTIIEIGVGSVIIFVGIQLVSKIFPAGQFKIGNGIKKYKELKWIRNTFLVTLISSSLMQIIEFIIRF